MNIIKSWKTEEFASMDLNLALVIANVRPATLLESSNVKWNASEARSKFFKISEQLSSIKNIGFVFENWSSVPRLLVFNKNILNHQIKLKNLENKILYSPLESSFLGNILGYSHPDAFFSKNENQMKLKISFEAKLPAEHPYKGYNKIHLYSEFAHFLTRNHTMQAESIETYLKNNIDKHFIVNLKQEEKLNDWAAVEELKKYKKQKFNQSAAISTGSDLYAIENFYKNKILLDYLRNIFLEFNFTQTAIELEYKSQTEKKNWNHMEFDFKIFINDANFINFISTLLAICHNYPMVGRETVEQSMLTDIAFQKLEVAIRESFLS